MSGFPPDTYRDRRRQLARLMTVDSVLLVPAAPLSKRNADVEHRFRQDADFWYLTGINEPEAILTLTAAGSETLYVRPRDPGAELWNGNRLGPEKAAEIAGVPEAYPISSWRDKLCSLLRGASEVYLPLQNDDLLRQVGSYGPTALKELRHLTGRLRVRKSDAELDIMRDSARISAAAHNLARDMISEGTPECRIEAALEGHFRSQGGTWAYPSIVASGANATVLHYTENNSFLSSGQLLLIDAGCELSCYGTDISRTWPVNGKLNRAQADLYDIVMRAQTTVISAIGKTARTYSDLERLGRRTIAEGLLDLGLLRGTPESVQEDGSLRRYFPHSIGHWLGLDVHDAGIGKDEPLEPGMIFTVEPGIYVSTSDESAPKAMQGTGIRIEDNVAIGADGLPENLTVDAEKLAP